MRYAESELQKSAATAYTSEEAEKNAICALLKGVLHVGDKLGILTEEDFGCMDYGKVYRAIQKTAAEGQAVNVATVSGTIRMIYDAEEAALVEQSMFGTITAGASPVMYEDYAEAIKKLSQRRKSINIIDGIGRRLMEPESDLDAVIDELRTELIQLQGGKSEWEQMDSIMIHSYEYIEDRAKGNIKSITSGIESVDKLIGGFFGGEMTIVGARPAVGKSAFALNIAYAAAKQGFKVGYVSGEMTNVQLGSRLLSRESRINGMRLRKANDMKDEDWVKLSESMAVLAELDVSFIFNLRTVEALRREVQRKVEQKALDILIIDYLQLMDTAQHIKEEHLRVGKISKELKQIALDFNIPIIALAQVNRATDGTMPTLKDLKDSGSIEQDADGVLFLHRPMKPDDPSINPEHKDRIVEWQKRGFDYIAIEIAKQRQGQIGKTTVLFDKAVMQYANIGG